jgi:hypothetical protein
MIGTPEFSVVVEWENARFAGMGRGARMLAGLAEQVRALGRAVEVLVVRDPAGADPGALGRLLADKLGPASWRLVDAPGEHYYGLKNRGAAEARAPVVVFIDSDAVPDRGWLAALVEPFADPEVQVVAGNTYVDPQGMVGRAFALGWFFPLRSKSATRHDGADHFWANNVAFRRALLLANPFPGQDDGATRGACVELAACLRAKGVRIWKSTAAQVSHSPPQGLRHFLVRALADGRDYALQLSRGGMPRWRLPLRCSRRYLKKAWRKLTAIARGRRDIDLGLRFVPVAWAVMGAYYLLAWLGALATCVAPAPMSRRLRI